MVKSVIHSYSRYSRSAVSLLGKLVRVERKQRRLTAQEVADRAGISRGLLQRIEKGDPKCGIGSVFEVAAIVGVKLFDAEDTMLTRYVRYTDDTLMLLPKSVRKPTRKVDDEF